MVGPRYWKSRPASWRHRLPVRFLVGHRSIGVNYIDIQHRSGRYPIKDFPCVPGVEGAGYIEAVGPDVKDLKSG